MRIIKDEPDERHSNLKALSSRSKDDVDGDDVESLLDEIELFDE